MAAGLAGRAGFRLLGPLATGVDAVTITTPPNTRRDLVLEALAAGVHVIADKPFAPAAAGARELARRRRRRAAAVRLPQPSLGLRHPHPRLRAGQRGLGEMWRVHSASISTTPIPWRPAPVAGCFAISAPTWSTRCSGCWADVERHAHLDWSTCPRAGRSRFVIDLEHTSGVAHVESPQINHIAVRELRAYGSAGSYRPGTDVQAQAIFAGRGRRTTCGWGYDAPRLTQLGAPPAPPPASGCRRPSVGCGTR